MNKKRETIRKPIDREPISSWDEQQEAVPSIQEKRGKRRSDEDDMIMEKDDD